MCDSVDASGRSSGEVAAWFSTWLLVPGFGLVVIALGRFPTGARPAGWFGLAELVAISALAILTIAQSIAHDNLDAVDPARPIPNPLGIEQLDAVTGFLSAVAAQVLVVYGCVALARLAWRARKAAPGTRSELRWVALAVAPVPLFLAAVMFEVLYGLDGAIDPTIYIGQAVIFGGLVVAIAHVVLRRNLYVRTRLVDQALVVVLLSGAVAAAYVALVAMIGLLVSDVTTAASLAAAGAAALLLTPLREAAQRATNRVVYGSTRDPFAVVDALVAKLDAAR